MSSYRCTDSSGADVTIEAESAEEAAQEYVDGGDWTLDKTTWIHVSVWPLDADGEELERERHTIRIDPDEPPCEGKGEHKWTTPHWLLGGLEENPGVWGHGGGVVCRDACLRCGCERVTDTWAQDPETGEEGLTSVAYEPGKHSDAIEAHAADAAATLGRKGGAVSSKAKTAAVRENGKLGGRPRKTVRVVADEENSAETWWSAARDAIDTAPKAARDWLGNPASDELMLTNADARALLAWAERLPGWADGPAYAPVALIIDVT